MKLIEAGPVALPAYQSTSVTVEDARSPEAFARLQAAKAALALAKAWAGPERRVSALTPAVFQRSREAKAALDAAKRWR